MAKIHSLTIKNFRGIENFEHSFNSDFVCLIGRGDSGKSTILEAISSVLSTSWNLPFFDNDFYNCNTNTPIVIEANVTDLPSELMKEDKFGLYLRGIDENGKVTDELEEIKEPIITIRLEVFKDLEPIWSIITNGEIGNKQISANDRAKLNAFLVSDYVDRHFSWSKGNPLYSLLKQEGAINEDDDVMISALREAKSKIDLNEFSKFNNVINKIKNSAALFGIDISKTNTTIDFKDIVIKDGKICLHDETFPFRLKGKGSQRLISMAIQASIANSGGIVLIDEIEQGLEPDRVQSLVNTLKQHTHGQIFITTHSRDVLVELTAVDVFLMRKGAKELKVFDSTLQGLLRKNPESFFAKKVLVAEGSTEIGICKALKEYRIQKGKKNASHLGIRIADGSGSEMIEYCKGFCNSGFPTALFCDSDDPTHNLYKPSLQALGIKIFDWQGTDCLEVAIIKYLPFTILPKVFELAAEIRLEADKSKTIDQHKTEMWQAVQARFGTGCPINIEAAPESQELRKALGLTVNKNSWFKRQDKAYRLGKFIFSHYDDIDEDNIIKIQLNALSNWIDDEL